MTRAQAAPAFSSSVTGVSLHRNIMLQKRINGERKYIQLISPSSQVMFHIVSDDIGDNCEGGDEPCLC